MDYTYSVDAGQTASNGGNVMWACIAVALWLISVIAMWRMFTKAKRAGWASLIPIYNTYVVIKMAGKPGWWLLLYLVPFVNIIVHLFVALGLAKAFGKSKAFGVFGIWIFSLIGFLILGYGDARYKGVPKS